MPPKLDHYVARPFVEITTGTHGWDWGIRLEGGVLVNNKDESLTEPPMIENGTNLLMVEEDGTHNMKFGTLITDDGINFTPDISSIVQLTADAYSIADPDFQGSDEVFPGRVPPDPLPEDPSDERVALGPTTP